MSSVVVEGNALYGLWDSASEAVSVDAKSTSNVVVKDNIMVKKIINCTQY